MISFVAAVTWVCLCVQPTRIGFPAHHLRCPPLAEPTRIYPHYQRGYREHGTESGCRTYRIRTCDLRFRGFPVRPTARKRRRAESPTPQTSPHSGIGPFFRCRSPKVGSGAESIRPEGTAVSRRRSFVGPVKAEAAMAASVSLSRNLTSALGASLPTFAFGLDQTLREDGVGPQEHLQIVADSRGSIQITNRRAVTGIGAATSPTTPRRGRSARARRLAERGHLRHPPHPRPRTRIGPRHSLASDRAGASLRGPALQPAPQPVVLNPKDWHTSVPQRAGPDQQPRREPDGPTRARLFGIRSRPGRRRQGSEPITARSYWRPRPGVAARPTKRPRVGSFSYPRQDSNLRHPASREP